MTKITKIRQHKEWVCFEGDSNIVWIRKSQAVINAFVATGIIKDGGDNIELRMPDDCTELEFPMEEFIKLVDDVEAGLSYSEPIVGVAKTKKRQPKYIIDDADE